MTTISLYEAVMGAQFQQLSGPVQDFHRIQGRVELHGWVQTEAPATPLARLLALCLGTPRVSSVGEIRFELDATPAGEQWVRHFPGKTMMSRLQLRAGVLTENLGLAKLYFSLQTADGRLVMKLRRLRFLGIPCPRWALPVIVAEETGRDGCLHFNVRAALPVIGQVAGYSGHLVLPPGGAK